jgi:hypothetical protein
LTDVKANIITIIIYQNIIHVVIIIALILIALILVDHQKNGQIMVGGRGAGTDIFCCVIVLIITTGTL